MPYLDVHTGNANKNLVRNLHHEPHEANTKLIVVYWCLSVWAHLLLDF